MSSSKKIYLWRYFAAGTDVYQSLSTRDTVGVWDHILKEFKTLYLTSKNLQNCYTTPNKNLGAEGASDR